MHEIMLTLSVDKKYSGFLDMNKFMHYPFVPPLFLMWITVLSNDKPMTTDDVRISIATI